MGAVDPPGSPREGQDQGRHQVAAPWTDGPGGGASQGQRRRLSLGVLMGEGGCRLDITSRIKTSFRFRWDKMHRHVMRGVIAVESLTASLVVVAEKWGVAELRHSPILAGSREEAGVYTHTPRTPDVTGDIPSIMYGVRRFRELVLDLTILRRRRA